MEDQQFKKDIKVGAEIERLMTAPAWKHIDRLWESEIKSLDTIEGVESIEDLKARQLAKQRLESWYGSILALIEKGSQAEAILNQKPDTF